MNNIRGHLQNAGIATNIGILHAIREHYPDHIVVQTPRRTGLLKFAEAGFAKASLVTDSEFYASRLYELRKDGDEEAGLKDKVELAKYDYQWKGDQYILYAANYQETMEEQVDNHYILGPQTDAGTLGDPSTTIDKLITAAALHGNRIDDEIWVYDRGYWRKNHKLWKNVQACEWDQVILDDEMKGNLVTDVEGFFDRKDDYMSFGVPWKRGIILHGLPGNGKTVSIKSLMRSLSARSPPVPTLYVKSLGRAGDHDDIREIFDKARETAPCLVVFEDIDSLVSDKVKSFFLNEVDGLEGNDGIMMIGSTNYLDRLDPGISKRPSRFDRKYHFSLPALSERVRYCDYWRSKLAKNTSLELHPKTSSEIAEITEGFSFAYLQEALVTALLELVHKERAGSPDNPGPAQILQAIKKQVTTLRKEMRSSRKSVQDSGKNSVLSDPSSSFTSTGFGLGT
ncbi:MAG: hypothetical protein L6R35_001184 [Caloplaca aegaea]|nr:MAG: hypothetical protein L6R35_001184 [Caloplaca aegaea]